MSEKYEELERERGRLMITLAYDVLLDDPAAKQHARELLDVSRKAAAQVSEDVGELIASLNGAVARSREVRRNLNTHEPHEELEP